MPTPAGHAVAGLAIVGLVARSQPIAASQIGVLIGCATAPDLDLILRLVDGANHHRGPTHSFTAAVIALVVGLVLGHLRFDVPPAWAMGAAWATHVVLDFFGLDTTPPLGEMALWPFSAAFFTSSVPVFYDVPRSFEYWAIVHNLKAVAIELVVLGPIAWVCWRKRPART